jgi:hypothetical protein
MFEMPEVTLPTQARTAAGDFESFFRAEYRSLCQPLVGAKGFEPLISSASSREQPLTKSLVRGSDPENRRSAPLS